MAPITKLHKINAEIAVMKKAKLYDVSTKVGKEN